MSEFSGLPNDNNTKAWDDLIKRTVPHLSPMNRKLTFFAATWFVASEEMLAMTGESIDNSVMLAEGGYLAGLGVYHDIHCLVSL